MLESLEVQMVYIRFWPEVEEQHKSPSENVLLKEKKIATRRQRNWASCFRQGTFLADLKDREFTSIMRIFAFKTSRFLGSLIKSDIVSPVNAISGAVVVYVICQKPKQIFVILIHKIYRKFVADAFSCKIICQKRLGCTWVRKELSNVKAYKLYKPYKGKKRIKLKFLK